MLANAAPPALCWPTALIVWGPGFVSAKHKQRSVKLVMAIEGKLRIRRGPPQKWTERGAALVKANTPHEVGASDREVLLAFVDPESDLGAGFADAAHLSRTMSRMMGTTLPGLIHHGPAKRAAFTSDFSVIRRRTVTCADSRCPDIPQSPAQESNCFG
jgi:hypothetical protein